MHLYLLPTVIIRDDMQILSFLEDVILLQDSGILTKECNLPSVNAGGWGRSVAFKP